MQLTIQAKSCEDMKDVPDCSISCIFTSPPYAIAKDYGDTGHIGDQSSFDSYGDYLKRMMKVIRECYRVLQYGRVIGVNIGDVVQDDKKGRMKHGLRYDMYTLMVAAGFKYIDTIIWKKPEGISLRYGHFIQRPYPMNYLPNNIHEPIIVMKKPGVWTVPEKLKEENKLDYEVMRPFAGDIWEVRPETNSEHPAPFPLVLPEVFFKLHALKGETVLDPFLGSGTSMIAAYNNGMSCIGFEINREYIDMSIKRMFDLGITYIDIRD